CPGAVPYDYNGTDKAATDRLLEDKYSTDWWNFGAGPRYSYTACKKFPSGFLELNMEVSGGVISGLEIFGDYFFTR
ncbi:lipoate--protein ligase family protein, partial [Pseudomonas aeruginosa]